MNNKFDFKDLIQFGMFIIALLTLIYLICTNIKKPSLYFGESGRFFLFHWSTTLWRLPFLTIL